TLPAPAYVLCAGYFFVFILSALLLHGLTVKRTLYLLGWLFVVGIFTFPEAGLHVTSINGLTELICWACRLICNIAGLVCVQSLYSTWKEEKIVLRRLQALNMASILAEGSSNPAVLAGNGHPKNGMVSAAGYSNAAFMGSTTNLSAIGGTASTPHHFRVFSPPAMVSEFNAATFNGMLAAGLFREVEPPQFKLSRSQSLGDLSQSTMWRMSSYAAQPAAIVDYVPMNATQSLDRRMVRYNARLRRAGSMDELNNLRYCHNNGGSLCCEGRVYNILQPTDYCLYGRPKFVNKSKISLTESDDLQKIRDVAL
ncbi:hypothetical protein C0J52_16511, partial [Blattella germanica]